MTKKGIIFISNVHKALEHEWFADAIVSSDISVEFVLFNSKDSELFKYITSKGIKCANYTLSSKIYIPYYIVRFWFRFLFKPYDFVHCHLFEASLIGIIASKMAGIKKRIYTRHHSDFHHTYFPHAVKYDLLLNQYATHIIAVSGVVKEILMNRENVPEKKITLIPHGIPQSNLTHPVSLEKLSEIKVKYNLKERWPVIGIVSRFAEWKGIQYGIPAFAELLKKYPEACLVLCNAQGDYETKLMELLKTQSPESYRLIRFENNMPVLFSAFDIFVHTPVDKYCEAFGQVYIESMCYGVPMVCTVSGIANELVVDEKNALVVDYKNSGAIVKAIERILENDTLKTTLVEEGKKSVRDFSFERKMERLINIYNR